MFNHQTRASGGPSCFKLSRAGLSLCINKNEGDHKNRGGIEEMDFERLSGRWERIRFRGGMRIRGFNSCSTDMWEKCEVLGVVE